MIILTLPMYHLPLVYNKTHTIQWLVFNNHVPFFHSILVLQVWFKSSDTWDNLGPLIPQELNVLRTIQSRYWRGGENEEEVKGEDYAISMLLKMQLNYSEVFRLFQGMVKKWSDDVKREKLCCRTCGEGNIWPPKQMENVL